MKKISIMFVCLGNICRSPVAEAVFRHIAKDRGLESNFHIASSGTGSWHVGETAHPETIKVSKRNGISLASHRAKQVTNDDINSFDVIVAMDRSNLRDLKAMKGASSANIVCLRNFDSEDTDPDVPDPFYGDGDGFQIVHDIIHRCCLNLLNHLENDL
jgi:protein-tyrosine phosphatase